MSEGPVARSQTVGTFYDLMGRFLDTVYGENIHYGYWPEGDKAPLETAQHRLNDLLTAELDLSDGGHLVDVGCGTGGPARRIAATTGAAVTGVTVSGWQVAEATAKAADARLTGRVRFEQADAAALPFADESFDAALFLEVLVHVQDKVTALAEACRVVRPGRPVVLAELVLLRPMSAEESALWSAMPMSIPPSAADYSELAAEAGLKVAKATDLSAGIRRSFTLTRQAVDNEHVRLAAQYPPRVLQKVRQGLLNLLDVSESCLGYLVLTTNRPD